MIWWSGTIQEIQVQMLNSCLCELLFVVLRFIKSDNQGDSHFLENWDIIIWSETSVFICNIKRP